MENHSGVDTIEIRIDHHIKALKLPRTYGQAIEVVMQYGHKRVRIAEMPQTDIERAQALVLRLQDAVNRVDLAMHMAERDLAAADQNAYGSAPEIR